MAKLHKKIRYIKQVTVYCDTEKRHTIMDKYHDKGYHCMSCGPKPVGKGVVSSTRHKLIFIRKTEKLGEFKKG